MQNLSNTSVPFSHRNSPSWQLSAWNFRMSFFCCEKNNFLVFSSVNLASFTQSWGLADTHSAVVFITPILAIHKTITLFFVTDAVSCEWPSFQCSCHTFELCCITGVLTAVRLIWSICNVNRQGIQSEINSPHGCKVVSKIALEMTDRNTCAILFSVTQVSSWNASSTPSPIWPISALELICQAGIGTVHLIRVILTVKSSITNLVV